MIITELPELTLGSSYRVQLKNSQSSIVRRLYLGTEKLCGNPALLFSAGVPLTGENSTAEAGKLHSVSIPIREIFFIEKT